MRGLETIATSAAKAMAFSRTTVRPSPFPCAPLAARLAATPRLCSSRDAGASSGAIAGLALAGVVLSVAGCGAPGARAVEDHAGGALDLGLAALDAAVPGGAMPGLAVAGVVRCVAGRRPTRLRAAEDHARGAGNLGAAHSGHPVEAAIRVVAVGIVAVGIAIAAVGIAAIRIATIRTAAAVGIAIATSWVARQIGSSTGKAASNSIFLQGRRGGIIF